MIDFPIIDAHHHLQDLSHRYPWLEGHDAPERYHGDDRPLRRDYLLSDYQADIEPFRLAGSVHVENGAGSPSWETSWIQSLNDSDGLPSAHVARVDLLAPTAPLDLEKAASFPVVRGIRYMLNWHEDPFYQHVTRADLMDDPTWRSNFARLAPLGLSFDLQVFPAQLIQAAGLVSAHPDTVVVLDHAGMPIRRDADGVEEWRQGMRALAALENVTVKISALGTNDHHWSVDSIRPFVRETIEFFGPDRCMFGSNFPVDSLYSTLTELFGAFDDITSDLSDSERRDLFAGTAARAYRLTPSTKS